ncbi:hypothetical protein L3Y34_019273 [Caenorhabditis briggsae]|uniref:C-type lectin domain-containing protein n=2 Tax=Caenorhabditis briggsae TaxID=6238 RepID=A0AAE9DPJ2_CAEBR|nr:hypothetical protein L3Y34_019273 [Caenorhabditis briggsae]
MQGNYIMNTSSLLVLLFCFSATFAAVPVAMKCPDGWKWFIRSRGGWCMKVFVETLVQEKAEEKCVAQGATIAGVQNANESAWMRSEFESQYKTPAYMWVGGKRIKPCLNSVALTVACSRVTTFYWTDNSTVGVQGFTWKEGEPNNYGGGGQECLQVFSGTGQMDDVACGAQTYGYVCGKVASFN